MIFATVGVQLPFDRLIRTLDDWATRRGQGNVIAQVGASHYVAKTIECYPFMAPEVFRSMVERAELVVAHAGMGSIITAFELGKPIIVLPRRAALGEHRNDHQLATSRRMAVHETLSVAADEDDLVSMLDAFRAPDVGAAIASHASDQLLSELAGFIRRGGEAGLSR